MKPEDAEMTAKTNAVLMRLYPPQYNWCMDDIDWIITGDGLLYGGGV